METKDNSNKEVYTREEVKQQMLDYLHQKYGEKFIEVYTAYRTYGRNWEEMEVYPTGKSEDESFMVYRMTRENGEVYYTDRYVISCKQEEYKEYIESLVKPYFKEFKSEVYIRSYKTQENKLLPSISFEKFKEYVYKELDVDIHLFCLIDCEKIEKEDVDNNAIALESLLKQNSTKGSLLVFGYNTDCYKMEVLDKTDENYLTDNNWYEYRDFWLRNE